MKWAALALLGIAGLVLSRASGEDAVHGPPLPPRRAADVQDVVFLSERGPVLIRLRIRVEGEPFSARWDEYIARLFRYLDRDGDGVLSKEEAERAPSAEQMRQLLEGQVFFVFGGDYNRARMADLDTSPVDGVVTLEEFVRYYRQAGVGPLMARTTQGKPTASEAATEAIVRLLDTDGDGKLSREKMSKAADKLLEMDADDDEMIVPAELTPGLNTNLRAQPGSGARFFLVGREEEAARLARVLLIDYDKDKDKKLSRAEIGLGKRAFDLLDGNGDGFLDEKELTRLLDVLPDLPPDLEINVRLGQTRTDAGVAGPLAGMVRPVARGSCLLTLGRMQLQVSPAEAQGRFNNNPFVRQILLQAFKAADLDKKGYVVKGQLKSPEVQFLRSLFDLADHNADGKLTEEELLAYYDLHEDAGRVALLLRIEDLGPALFEVLDADRDGRLSQRELRTAWARLAPWSRSGDGRVAKADLPLQLKLTIARAAIINQVGGRFFTPAGQAKTARGPLWFRKMDRNGDGDVSRREFLGTPEEFKRIDTDGDGLIDADEAERADSWFRKRSHE